MDDRLIALDRTLRLLAEHVEATPDAIAAQLHRTVVTLRVGGDVGATAESQAAATTFVNLVVRSGLRVQLEVPPTPSHIPLLHGSFGEALCDLGERIIRGSVTMGASRPADLGVGIGSTAAVTAVRNLWLAADFETGGFSDSPSPFQPADVVGAMEPASMAAAESIRHALRHLPGRTPIDQRWLEPVHQARLPSPAVPRVPIDLGEVDVISAGAIMDAVLWVVLMRGEVIGRLRVFDDGRYELSNLNRYPLLDRVTALAGGSKASHLVSLAHRGLNMAAVERRFVASDISGARARILVGADDIAVRHLAQQAGPAWLGIGATGHDEVRVTEHEPDESCARCAHPHLAGPDDTPIPTIAPVSFQAGLRLAGRLLGFAAGRPTPARRRYATYWPLRPGTSTLGPTPTHPACPIHGSPVRAA